MTATSNQPSRRDLLKWFAGIPFLPLGAMSTAAALSGCNDSDNTAAVITPPTKPANLKNAKFTPMAAPDLSNAAAMATTTVASKLTIEWDNNTQTEYQLGYKAFFNTGVEVDNLAGGKILAGGYYDIHNQPILDTSLAGTSRQFFSDCPDGSSLIHIEGANLSGVYKPVFQVV